MKKEDANVSTHAIIMYLKQKGVKITGSNWLLWLIEFSPTYAEPWSQRCCGTWGIFQFMRRRHKIRVQWFWWLFKRLYDIRRVVIWNDVSTGGRNPTAKLGMRESMGGVRLLSSFTATLSTLRPIHMLKMPLKNDRETVMLFDSIRLTHQ